MNTGFPSIAQKNIVDLIHGLVYNNVAPTSQMEYCVTLYKNEPTTLWIKVYNGKYLGEVPMYSSCCVMLRYSKDGTIETVSSVKYIHERIAQCVSEALKT